MVAHAFLLPHREEWTVAAQLGVTETVPVTLSGPATSLPGHLSLRERKRRAA
jgi:hypothetical protein